MINRGNYRSDVFKSSSAADSFLKTLEEAVEKFGWILFGYVLMRNHYHLAIETPRGNLSGAQSKGSDFAHCTNSLQFHRFAITPIRRLKTLAAVLEEMAGFFSEAIKPQGKSRLQSRHAFDQVCLWGFQSPSDSDT